MTDRSDGSLDERVASLEGAVATLQRTLKQLIDRLAERESRTRPSTAGADTRRSATRVGAGAVTVFPPYGVHSAVRSSARSGARASQRFTRASQEWFAERDPQFWLSRVGIGLVLFGVVFLFKYAVDRGWLSETIRVALGVLLGAGLYVIGIRLHGERAWFGRVLMGGGIAALYITGFAAFQWFELVSYTIAFAFMVLVTTLAIYTALWQDEAVLSVIGTVGALATPFLLYRPEGSVAALSLYTAVVIIGAGAVFIHKGWRALLLVNVIGGWMVLFTAVAAAEREVSSATLWVVQLAVLVALMVFWALPVVRVGRIAPTESAPPYAQVLSVVAPLVTLWYTATIWDLSVSAVGWLAMLGVGLLTTAAFVIYRWENTEGLAYAQAVSATVLLTVGVGLLLDGEVLLVAWTAEALALHAIAKRTTNRFTAIGGHVLFAIAALWLGTRLVTGDVDGTPIINVASITDLAAVVMIFIAAMYISNEDESNGYRLLAHIAFLGWLWRELSALPNGNGFVTIAWGMYSIGLLVFAFVRRISLAQKVALATLLFVVGKLFLVDLARVEAIWRILLFLGFGGLFLVLSYYFRDLWLADAGGPAEESVAADETG